MPHYPYPDVPQLPGVPQVNRSPAFPPGPPPQLSGALALGRLVQALTQKSQWGIFPDLTQAKRAEAFRNAHRAPGDPLRLTINTEPSAALVPDSFRTFKFKQEYNVSDAPTEDGGFASYNKVNNPFEIVLRMTKGGSRRDRTEFLEKLDALSRSLDLLKVVTPEQTYLSMNITGYSINRDEARGAYWFGEIDVMFREIRFVQSEYTSSAASTQNSRTPGAAPIENGGIKQALPPPDTVAAAPEVP